MSVTLRKKSWVPAHRRPKQKPQDIDLVPLINIVFLILIFFIVAGQFKRPQPFDVDLALSQSEKTTEGGSSDETEIFIDRHGNIAIGMDRVTIHMLQDRLARLDKSDKQSIRILADGNSDIGHAGDLLDALRQSGVRQVRFAVREALSSHTPADIRFSETGPLTNP